MSFTSDVRDELARVAPQCSHCEKAELAALLRIEGTLFVSGLKNYRVEINIDSASVARLVLRLLHSIYKLETELVIRRSVLHKTPNYLIEIPSQAHLADALFDMGVITQAGGLEMSIKPELIAKSCCAAAYLRGAFLGSGFISDPRSDFHFEITVESAALAQGLIDIMAAKNIAAKTTQRRNSHIVYLKSGSSIMEFLAFTGAHHGALSLEEERVVKSVRNDVNRQINAEVANQQKASKAAIQQLLAIRSVLNHTSINSLPQALQEYIRLRVKNPEATLKELGELANPPLSKSAINHRMRRIEAMAQKINSHN